MFKNLTIKSRLIFVLLFLSAQLLIGALIGIGSLSVANDAMRSMYDNRVVCLDQLDRIVRLLNVNQLNVAQAISASERELDPLMDEVDRNIQTVSKIWGEYTATHLTPEEKRLADSFAEHRGKFVGEGLKPAMAAVRARDLPMAARILHEKMKPLFAPVREDINALISLQLQVARAEYDASQANYRLVRNSCIAGLAIGLALALVAGVLLVRAIVRPLDTAVRVAEAVAGGDLTQRIEADRMDETGRLLLALRKMNDGLVQIVSQVRAGTDAIATGSGQIASGNHDLSSRTEQQASSLEETASSMEELTSTVRQNADNARQANTLAVAASEVAVRGGGVVTQVVGTMEAINESARKIADIIGVIDGIAFQTNILALNAAVEAARAGEQGRGFAVVASEVRSLAQRSANAAREIRTLITDSVEKVEDGSRLVSQAGATMDEIVDSVRRVTDIMGEITAASQEQTAGIEQINQAIAQMDQVTQQNASLVEEAAAASESLQEQAARLAQTVSTFRLDANLVQRASTAPARPASPPAARPAKQPASPVPALAGKEDWDEF